MKPQHYPESRKMLVSTPSNVNNKNEQIRELTLALAHFSKMQVLIEFKIF